MSELRKIKKAIEDVKAGKYHRKITLKEYKRYFTLKGYTVPHNLTLKTASLIYDLEKKKLPDLKRIAKDNNMKSSMTKKNLLNQFIKNKNLQVNIHNAAPAGPAEPIAPAGPAEPPIPIHNEDDFFLTHEYEKEICDGVYVVGINEETGKQYPVITYNEGGKDRNELYIISAKVKYEDGEWSTHTIIMEEEKCTNINNEFDEKNAINAIFNKFATEYTALSKVEVKHFKLKYVNLNEIPHWQKNLGYKFLEDINGVTEEYKEDKMCVFRYLVDSLTGENKFKKFDATVLATQLKNLDIDYTKGMTVDDMEMWIKEYYPNTISLRALDPYLRVFKTYIPPNHNTIVMLTFICNNCHIYPITNEQMQHYIAKAGRFDDKGADIKFSYQAYDYKPIYIENPWLINQEEFITEHHQQYKQSEWYYNRNSEYSKLVHGELEGQVFLVQNVYDCAVHVANCTGYMVTSMNIKDGEVKAFIHPTAHYIIEDGDEYINRLTACNILYKEYKCEDFRFSNQSYGQLANSLFEMKFGCIGMKSSYTEEQMRITDTFGTCPFFQTIRKEDEYVFDEKWCKGFDINNCYPSAAMNMKVKKYNYPVFSILDDWEHYNGGKIILGEYLVDHFTAPSGVIYQKQILSYIEIIYLLENNYMDKSKILLVRKASHYISCDPIAEFMEIILQMFPRHTDNKTMKDINKSLGCCFIGTLGKRYTTQDKGFMTNSYDTVCGMYFQYPEGFHMTPIEDIYFVRNTIKTRMVSDHSPIFRQILCMGHIQLHELLKVVMKPTSKLIGYKTDAVFVYNPNQIDFKEHKDRRDFPLYKNENWKVRRYTDFEVREDSHEITEKKNWIEIKDVGQDLKNTSFCCTGSGGSGKTTLAKKNYVDGETIMLCVSNRACQNLVEALGNDKYIKTFDSQFWKTEDSKTIFNNIKRVIVDEYSQVPLHWIKKLIQLKESGCIIQMYGDMNQCSPVQDRYVDVMEKKAFRELCDNNIIYKKYIKGQNRANEALNELKEKFIKYQRIPNVLKDKKIDPTIKIGICKTNPKRIEINELVNDSITHYEDGTKIEKIHKFFYPGLKVISNINDKLIFRSRFYYIHSIIDANRYTLTEQKGGEPLKNKKGEIKCYNVYMNRTDYTCDPAWCITTYRYQGSTINEKYNIYEVEKMNFNEFNTAFGRGTCIENIFFNYTPKFFVKPKEPNNPTLVEPIMKEKGEIYELHNSVENCYYVGMTTNTTEERFQEHKTYIKDPIHQHGKLDDWKARKITDVYYHKKEELEKVETKYIAIYHSQGKRLVNTLKVPKNYFKITTDEPAIDEKIREKYHIYECKGFVKLQWCEDGKKKEIRRKTKKNPEKAMQQIEEMKNQLIENDKKFVLNFESKPVPAEDKKFIVSF